MSIDASDVSDFFIVVYRFPPKLFITAEVIEAL